MNCSERVVELVECARRGESTALLDRDLRTHLMLCASCSDRWNAERQLTVQLRIMQMRTADLCSPVERRESLLRNFSLIHRPTAFSSRIVPQSAWALSAAAALLLAVFVGHEAGRRPREAAPVIRNHFQTSHGVSTGQPVVYEASVLLDNFSSDAGALSNDDFVPVPWTPPLAPGEMVRVVHADLNPEALANMGLAVDPAWSGELPADVVVGEDGLPRAVRITDNEQN